jgi:hypothetical protein
VANSFTSPPTLPDQSLTLAGEVLRAQTLEAVVDTYNWAHAEGPTSPAVSQEWADGQCSWANTAPGGADAPATEVAVWRIPQVSPAHQTLTVSCLCSQSNNPAQAGTKATFTINGDSADISPDFGASTYKDVDLTFGQPGAGYADLQLDLTSPAGSITLEDITARFQRLTSALDNGPAGGVAGAYSPMGPSAVVADKPLAARRGRKIIHNSGVLLAYPRSVFCWSALRGIQAWSNAALAEDYARAFPRRSVMTVRPRLLAQGGTYTVWVRVVPDAAATRFVFVHAGSIAGNDPAQGAAGWGVAAATIEVAPDALQVPVWYTETIRVPETRTVGLPWLTAAVGIYPGTDHLRGYTTAQVIGLSIWGA